MCAHIESDPALFAHIDVSHPKSQSDSKRKAASGSCQGDEAAWLDPIRTWVVTKPLPNRLSVPVLTQKYQRAPMHRIPDYQTQATVRYPRIIQPVFNLPVRLSNEACRWSMQPVIIATGTTRQTARRRGSSTQIPPKQTMLNNPRTQRATIIRP
jgi:hypothetical protein